MKSFAYGVYENKPLHFVPLLSLTAEKKVMLLSQFDEWYGNTDQDTEDWAMEFQLLTRNLVNCDALILNPRCLALGEVLDELLSMLTPEQSRMYRKLYNAAVQVDGMELHPNDRVALMEFFERAVLRDIAAGESGIDMTEIRREFPAIGDFTPEFAYKFEEGDEVEYEGNRGIICGLLKGRRYTVFFDVDGEKWSEDLPEDALS